MSHAVDYLDFDVKESKETIQHECDDWYNCNKDWQEAPGYGHIGRIEYIDRVFNNRNEAQAYIDRNDYAYRLFGVKYLTYPDFKPSAKLTKLREKRQEAYTKLDTLEKEKYLKTITSTLVTCKSCGSKISREGYLNKKGWVNRNICPVCDTDFRPKTNLDRIAKARTNLEQIEKEIAEEKAICEQKQKKNAKLMWLIKLECHC